MSFYLWNDPATDFVNYIYENIAHTHIFFFFFLLLPIEVSQKFQSSILRSILRYISRVIIYQKKGILNFKFTQLLTTIS